MDPRYNGSGLRAVLIAHASRFLAEKVMSNWRRDGPTSGGCRSALLLLSRHKLFAGTFEFLCRKVALLAFA